MAILNFPTNPALNDTYSFGGKTWIWNGYGWQLASDGNISVTGNITASYFIGNGSQLTGILASGGTSIDNGLSNVAIKGVNANVTVSVDGVENVATFTTNGLSVTANVIAGNLVSDHFTYANGVNILSGAIGTQGTTGAQGTIGAQGITGAQGTTGIGTQGATGTGTQGTTGAQGANGAQGIIGAQGTQGIVGAQGTQGIQGRLGQIGPVGIQGQTGSQGIGGTGSQGTTGAQGTRGSQGTFGAQGTVGAQGTTGAQGIAGAQGIQGVLGAQGTVGAQGTTGAQGTVGAQGTTGAQGVQGLGDRYQTTSNTSLSITVASKTLTVGTGLNYSIGQQATIAYDISNYMIGTVSSYDSGTGELIVNITSITGGPGPFSSWSVNLTGTPGASGPQGTTGSQGTLGAQGTTGTQGITGAQGTTGTQGTIGAQGTNGAQGITGTQGTTGTGTQGTTGVQGIQGIAGTSTPTQIINGTSNVTVVSSDGNVTVGINGTGNVAVFTTTGVSLTGNVVANNISGNGSAITSVMADRGGDQNNWDTLTQMGVYTVNRVSWSATIGTPTDSQVYVGLLQVMNSTSTAITQVFLPGTVESGNVKIQWNRSYWSGTWTSWYKIVNDYQVVSGGEF